jgi:hypothetical protein
LDLLNIREISGSKNFAFEEFCCQLVSLEKYPKGDVYYRKGSGADAGVECFVAHSSGNETGWQAKFFNDFGDAQVSQLTESISSAFNKHPKLTRYIVCLLINLKDSRAGRGMTELDRWNKWKKKQIEMAKENGRSIEISLWSATDLKERLVRNDAYYSGRLEYFFSETYFTPEWFNKKFELSLKSLGSRYSPQFNVGLPIRRAFAGFCRLENLIEGRKAWLSSFLKHVTVLANSTKHNLISKESLDKFLEIFDGFQKAMTAEIIVGSDVPVGLWKSLLKDFSDQALGSIENMRSRRFEFETKKEDLNYYYSVLNDLYRFLGEIRHVENELEEDLWKLCNERVVMLYGEPGIGKSHLLADVADDYLMQTRPALLLLSSMFSTHDPRTQILEKLDLRNIGFGTFLGALDAAGQKAGVRALLIIDALNERHGIEIWREHLASLIAEVKEFPNIGLLVSCRSTYLNAVIPKGSSLESIAKIQHHGFATSGGRAAKEYLAFRKIVRPSAPNLSPEFNNPLFLKTCCDSLEKQGLTEIPKGIDGITALLDFYLTAISQELVNRLGLDPNRKIVDRAVEKFVEKLIYLKSSYLPIADAVQCFDSIQPSSGSESDSLLRQFEHEGLITVEPVYVDGSGKSEDCARFTFERISDYRIAHHLFNEQIAAKHSVLAFQAGTPLHDFLSEKDLYMRAGVVDALATILPEKCGMELPMAYPTRQNEYDDFIIRDAFSRSLLIRAQDSFTEKTKQQIHKYFHRDDGIWLRTLIAVATEPSNQFNADYLHAKLVVLKMPERDANWSAEVANLGLEEHEGLELLLEWALESSMEKVEEVRAKLCCTMLTWLLATTHRPIRDRATKALSSFLVTRLHLAEYLLDKFHSVDDLYIVERLLAAIYGAVLLNKQRREVEKTADVVYKYFFDEKQPPVHLLLRDYARGIIEFANSLGAIPKNICLTSVRPPYKSEWSVKYISEARLDEYSYLRNGHLCKDDITHSAGSEWMGDFAKYEINPAVTNWLPLTIGEKNIFSSHKYFDQWVEGFSTRASTIQLNALNDLHDFCVESAKSHLKEILADWDPDQIIKIAHRFVGRDDEGVKKQKEDNEKFSALEKTLIDVLNENDQYEYQTQISYYMHQLRNGRDDKRSPSFDQILAQRWVTIRAHELGWNKDLHEKFDDWVGTGRSRENNHIERIGKKYQWLALYELLARMADNLAFKPEFGESTGTYDGPWQISLRDIDPSLLRMETYSDGWQKTRSSWWSPVKVNIESITRSMQEDWLEIEQDQLNSSELIDVTDSVNGEQWLVLEGVRHHSKGWDEGSHVDTWCRIQCFVVEKDKLASIVNTLTNKVLKDPHALPSYEFPRHIFLGEFPWHVAFNGLEEWVNLRDQYPFEGKVIPLVTDYNAETGNSDHSLNKSIQIHIPSPWLCKLLGLQLLDAHSIHFGNETGKVLFKDPTTTEFGPSAALVNKMTFLNALESKGLAPVWIIAGEKGAYGAGHHDYVGRRVHTSLYTLDQDGVIKRVHHNIDHERFTK